MQEIKLTQGKIALVDDENFEYLNQFKWCSHKRRSTFYAVRNEQKKGKSKTILMHREIMLANNSVEVDHKNLNGLHNYKENLRLCTSGQNRLNAKAHRDNKLKTKGVYWNRMVKKFMARIQIQGKEIYLGCFTVLADADQAYRVAELKYFGEFAREETQDLYKEKI